MEDIYQKIAELYHNGHPSVLATIIRQLGSAPRGVGTKFLVLEDGSYVGTIGGGLLEAQVLEGAREVFLTSLPKRLRFVLRGTDVAKTDMVCGGDAEVFLEPLSPENPNYFPIFKRVVEIIHRGGSGILVTLLTQDPRTWKASPPGFGKAVPRMFLGRDGEKIGSIPGMGGIEDSLSKDLKVIVAKKQTGILTYKDDEGMDLELFVEPVMSGPILYIFGGGHVSTQIVPLAHRLGFKVVVIDDRPEFAHPEKFPEAAEVHQYPFEAVLDRLYVDENSYVVIVTRGHTHDHTVLAQTLRSPAGYIGMIGSRRKRDIIYQDLLKRGFTKDDLHRVHSPIGLSIGAETPEEIAVSIVAELIKVRAGITGNTL